jgi:hypothetical protein
VAWAEFEKLRDAKKRRMVTEIFIGKRLISAHLLGDSPISQLSREFLSFKRQVQKAYSADPASARQRESVAHYAIASAMPG